MRPTILLILLLAFSSCASVDGPPPTATATPTATSKAVPVERTLYWNLRGVFRQHYKGFTAHQLESKFHFERDTRAFVVHVPLMTGEWQDPRETRGPKRGGVLCDARVVEGRWQGQAMVPQRFDRHYFYVYLMAPYSEKLDCHLYVLLTLPKHGVPEGFLKEFTEIVEKFDTFSLPGPE